VRSTASYRFTLANTIQRKKDPWAGVPGREGEALAGENGGEVDQNCGGFGQNGAVGQDQGGQLFPRVGFPKTLRQGRSGF
jgi:hypothetical protein